MEITNTRLEYWIESIECALEDIGKLDMFSEEDIKSLAETLQISSEQEDMAFGVECIPNPLEITIENLKSKYEKEIAELEHRDLIFRKNVSDRHGPYVKPENVYIKGNNIFYDK